VLFGLLDFGSQKNRIFVLGFQNPKAQKSTYLRAFLAFAKAKSQKKPHQTPPRYSETLEALSKSVTELIVDSQ
jgi:hypothetical protein